MSQTFDFTKFKVDFLNELNLFRQDHGAPPLTYSDNLEASAMEKAKHLFNSEDSPVHLDLRGVNDIIIQLTTNVEIKPSFFINNFKDSRNAYDFSESKYVEKAGGFTQTVWVNTRHIALGHAHQDERWFFVLRFFPYGNIEGRFTENVKPQGSAMSQRTNDGPIPLKSVPTPTEMETYFTKYHAEVRAKYGLGPLIWDNQIVKEAIKGAELIIDAKIANSDPPKLNEEYGKNIAYSSTGIPPMDTVMNKWYDAHKNFSYDTYECNETNGSFVQMVCKNTTHFGVAVIGKNNGCIYVAFYHPRLIITENFNEEFPKPINDNKIVFEENS